MQKKEIIILTKFIPAPAYTGGTKRVLSWIKFLSKYYKIHLVGFYNKNFNDKYLCELKKYDVIVYGQNFKRKFLKNIISSIQENYSMINLQYYNENLLSLIRGVLKVRNIEFILCEELAMMRYAYEVDIPVFFDDHNIEYILIKRTAKYQKNIFIKIFLYREYKLIKKEEEKAFKLAKKVFLVSENDKSYIDKDLKNKFFIVNNTYEEKNTKSNNINKSIKNIVFVGNISWKPNCDGLINFIKNIFPFILKRDNNVVLNIVGSDIPKKIKKYKKNNNIHIYENVTEEIKDKIVDNSILGIVPIYYGSGTRIKILEYWSHSKAVISTSIGAEGLKESKGTYICDKNEDFVNKILVLLNDKDEILNAGYENNKIFKNNYCEGVVYENSLYSTFDS